MKLFVVAAKIIVFIGVWTALLYAGSLLTFNRLHEEVSDPALFEFLRQSYALTITLIVVVLGILIIDDGNGFPKIVKRPWRDLLLGLFMGIFWSGITFLLFLITDSIYFGEWLLPSRLTVWVLAVLLNVLTQEIILRGYVYTVVSRGYGAFAAITVSSLISLLVQGETFANGAIAVIFTVSVSVLYGILRYYTSGLLAPVITHLIWNLVGGLGLGLVNLGDDYPSIYAENVVGANMLSGGSAGFEGSALSVIVCILLIDLVAILIADASRRKTAAKDKER
jgi:membrane protease YdiL (CAAX protease family)